MKKLSIVIILFFLSGGVSAQVSETLTLEQAIALALENNHELKIQKRKVTIAESSVFPGNAGLVPTISLIADASYQNNDTEAVIRTFQDSPSAIPVSDGAAATTTYGAVVQADYLLLGGFSGKYQYKVLKEQRDAAYFQQQALINETIIIVSEQFLEIVKLQSQEELLERNVKIEEERLKKVTDQFAFGNVSGLTVLKAKTDLNEDLTALDNVLVAKNNLKRDLNFLIGLDASSKYRVSVNYRSAVLSDVERLRNDVLTGNPNVLWSKKGISTADNQYRANAAMRLPTVNLFANYGYFNQQNDVQQVAELEALGYSVGMVFKYKIFTGGKTNNNIQKAKLNQEISRFQNEQVEDRVVAEAIKELNNLVLLKNQLQREEENIETFRESYNRTEERFYNGKSTSLDLRDAQISLINAEIVINNLKADIVKSSLKIEALKGNLMQSL